MSAITGIFRKDGQDVVTDEIKKMNNKIAHRGPDGSGIWCEGPVALGHQMLQTTPESLHEELPFNDEDSGLVITADARIDNRKELAPKLGIEDNEYVSDSYFILKAYEKWGEKCPEMLLGDFAFAIWDPKKEQLFCARDHMGVKPFYYYITDDLFCFATEIKALFTIPGVPRNLNEIKIAYYLVDFMTDKLLTFFKDIYRLESANYLKIAFNHKNKRQYWKLNRESKIIMDSDEDYFKAFRQIFDEAVNCRLRSAYPRGFELSGGMDTSSIVSMARNIIDKEEIINTYSYVFDDFPESDERYYINKVVEIGTITPTYIYGDNYAPFSQIETTLWHEDQPVDSPFLPLTGAAYQKMKDNKVRILLTGSGGDGTIFTGSSNYLKELTTTFRWKKAIKEIYNYTKIRKFNIFKALLYYFLIPLIPEPIKKFSSSRNPTETSRRLSFFNEDFIKKFKINEFSINETDNIDDDSADSYHFYLLNNISLQSTIETIDHWCSAFNIEPRHPFLDKRLIEFSYALPTNMKFRNGWNRFILRAGLDGILPKENQWRPDKAFLSQVIIKNLILYEEKKIKKILYHNTNLAKFIDLDKLKIMYQKYEEGISSNERDILFIWSACQLSLWLDEIDKNLM